MHGSLQANTLTLVAAYGASFEATRQYPASRGQALLSCVINYNFTFYNSKFFDLILNFSKNGKQPRPRLVVTEKIFEYSS